MSWHRKTIILLLFSLAGSSVLLFPASSRAAAAPQGKSTAKSAQEPSGSLIVGTVASERGTTAAIPLYFQRSNNTNVRSVHLELDFVSNSIQFTKAEKGVAAEGQNFEVTAEAKQLPPDDKKITHTRLNIDVSVADSDSKKSLPEGLLAFLNFKIPDDAKPFSISLTPITIAAQDSSKKPVEVAAEAGKVIVSIPDAPLAGCFFFTH